MLKKFDHYSSKIKTIFNDDFLDKKLIKWVINPIKD